MSDRFRIGVIGCGKIAPRHAQACLNSNALAVGVLVDPCHDRADDLAKRLGIAVPIRSRLEDAFEDADGFVIATPNHVHCSVALECLRAGKPVLIEKPLAANVEDGETICRAAEEFGTMAAVGYVTRFRRNVRLMHDLLKSNYFGRVHRFAYQYGTRGGWTPYTAYNLDRSAMGGGVLVSTGSHFLDRMVHWFGYPDDVRLEDDAIDGPEANAHVCVRYLQGENAFGGVALFSRTVQLRPGFIMETDAGLVLLEDEVNSVIRFRPSDRSDIELTVRRCDSATASASGVEADSFQLQLEDFADASRSNRAPHVPAREALEVQRLMEQLYKNRTPMPSGWYSSTTYRAGI